MRNLSSDALAKIRTKYGTEPIVILEIRWGTESTDPWWSYADRDIPPNIEGRIIDLSALDDVVGVSDGGDSQEISVTLDDTDGVIKDIMDHNDIHKRDVRVWQWFTGLDLSDKFLLFSGKINTPIEWTEGGRTVSFSVISTLEDVEFGFSPEEGKFPSIPSELIGKAWPSIFGTPLDVPAVAIGKAVHGTTLASLGIISGSGFYTGEEGLTSDDYVDTRAQVAQSQHLSFVMNRTTGSDYANAKKQKESIDDGITRTNSDAWIAHLQRAQESARIIAKIFDEGLGADVVRILGGEKFPRGLITLDINGGLFSGSFGNTPDTDNLFTIQSRYHPENEAEYQKEVDDAREGEMWYTPYIPPMHQVTRVPCDNTQIGDSRCAVITDTSFNGIARKLCKSETVCPKRFWVEGGSAAVLYGNDPLTYIVSIVPGTVLAVKAWKTYNGVRHLVDVPSSYYTVVNQNYGSINAVQVVVNKTLSTLKDQNWGDELFVTFRSSIGPNIVDIITYIINTYTDFSIDATSFAHCHDRLEIFPANFAVLDRKNVLTLLQEIALQARCSLRLVNGTFYMTYLPEVPVTADTITESDVEFDSIKLSLSSTEDLATKLTATWRVSYAPSEANKIILRHNIKKYGVHEKEVDFYCFNSGDIVLKIATFWLIRWANTWKQLEFKTFLHKLNVETHDAVMLNFSHNYVSDGPILSIVTGAEFDPADRIIVMKCWVPIKSGSMTQYDFAWPADVDPSWIFPTEEDAIFGGGGGIGEDADGILPVDPSEEDEENPWRQIKTTAGGGGGGNNNGSGEAESRDPSRDRGHDKGDKTPTDKGFQSDDPEKQRRLDAVPSGTSDPDPKTSTRPGGSSDDMHGYLKNPFVTPTNNLDNELTIDLARTRIVDSTVSTNLTKCKYLNELLAIDADHTKLYLKKDIYVLDVQTGESAEFDIKYDSESEKFGIGTAWLKED